MLRRLSLRARLVLGVIAIAAVGLVVADVATYRALSSFLLDRVDSTLDSVHPGIETALFGRPGARSPGRAATSARSSTRSRATASRCGRTNQAILAATCIPRFGQSAPAPGPEAAGNDHAPEVVDGSRTATA